MLAQNIDTIAVCELRRGCALQCFHFDSVEDYLLDACPLLKRTEEE